MKILDASRRDAAATKFTLLAAASLVLVIVGAVVPVQDGLRSAMAIAALVGYVYFAGRAMPLWQGRGQPSLRRPAWRRRLCATRVRNVRFPP
ncbi:MAG: hypothetical protein M3542_10495 [Acidobacteriota bacterium]|nr:hypothetical protein [Acidobacteriota bacterium]MDQ5872696.1 hypothetical protein [Acidobacteriota bacterium]